MPPSPFPRSGHAPINWDLWVSPLFAAPCAMPRWSQSHGLEPGQRCQHNIPLLMGAKAVIGPNRTLTLSQATLYFNWHLLAEPLFCVRHIDRLRGRKWVERKVRYSTVPIASSQMWHWGSTLAKSSKRGLVPRSQVRRVERVQPGLQAL